MNIEDLTLEEAWEFLNEHTNVPNDHPLKIMSSEMMYLRVKFGDKLDADSSLGSQDWSIGYIKREYGKQMAIIKAELAAATEQLVSEQINRLVQKKGGGHHHLIEQENKKKHRRGK